MAGTNDGTGGGGRDRVPNAHLVNLGLVLSLWAAILVIVYDLIKR